MRQVLRAVIAAIAWAILAGVALGYAGPLALQFDALAHFRLHFALAIPAVAVAALALRHWVALWRLGAAGVLAVAGLGAIWETPTRSVEGTVVTVLTANLFQGNPTPEIMRAALLAMDADILVTQETSKAAQEGITSLARHRVALRTRGRALRTVLWSKFPMRDGALMLNDQVEPTGVRAVVQLDQGTEVGILGLHLAHTLVGNQGRQIAALDRIAEPLPPTRIVLGDLNTTPWSSGMQRIQRLTGSRRIGGYRVTWYGSYPTPLGDIPASLGQPIDHVLVSPDIGVDAVRTIAIPGSDHLGVLATLRIPAGPDVPDDATGHTLGRVEGGQR